MTGETLSAEGYAHVKRELEATIKMIAEQLPDAAQYLRDHLKFDDERKTVTYTGDDRFKLEKP